jgi:hypothetical protein
MTATSDDKNALLREALECLRQNNAGVYSETGMSLTDRIAAALAGQSDGWLPMSGKYTGEIWRNHPALKGPDGRVWPAALETVNVLVQRPRYLEAQIARLWLDTDRNIQTSFPCGDAIRWQPLPPLPKE